MRPLPDPTYFLDENLDSHEIARQMREAGLRCVRLSERFERGEDDETWIPIVAREGWWTISRDTSMGRRQAQIGAIRKYQAIHIWIRGESLLMQQMASLVIDAHPRLAHFITRRAAPMIVNLHSDGRFNLREGGKRLGGPR